jgi:hypothetical protein
MYDTPKRAYNEGRLEDARLLLVEEYSRKKAVRLIQIDGHQAGVAELAVGLAAYPYLFGHLGTCRAVILAFKCRRKILRRHLRGLILILGLEC